MSVSVFRRAYPAPRFLLLAAAVPGLAGLLAGCAGEPAALLATGALPPAHEAGAGSGASASARRAEPRASMAASTGTSSWSVARAPVSPSLPPAKAAAKKRGLDALADGKLAEAERHLRRAVDAKAADWHVHSALGVALAGQAKHSAAQQELAKALSLAPDHPSVLNNLALSYALDGKLDQAEHLLRRSLSGQNGTTARKNLALLLGARGKLEEARGILEKSLPENAKRPTLAYLERLSTGPGRAGPATDSAAVPRATRVSDADPQGRLSGRGHEGGQ
jgi:Flp pilus assembly protein TadD